MDDCAGAQGVNAIAVSCDDDRGVGDPGASSRIADLDNETWSNHLVRSAVRGAARRRQPCHATFGNHQPQQRRETAVTSCGEQT